MTPRRYDAIVIGTGQGGGPLATTLAEAGWKVASIERAAVGGSCINYGCTPTKTMVASARIAYLARRSADYGVHTGSVIVDMAEVRQRKRDMVEKFRSSSEKGLEETEGLDLIRGEASFVDAYILEVELNNGGTTHIAADKIIINTGARPVRPPVKGMDKISVLDSTSIMELNVVPKHLLIIGGGYVGLEFGQMFRRFGSQVTILQRDRQLLSREDSDIAAEVAKILREDGIEILLKAEARQVEQINQQEIQLTVDSQQGERILTGSHLLVAAGRAPNTEALDLNKAGIDTDEKGFIEVDESLETNLPSIYAIGDVKGGPAFTHISFDDYRILRTNLLEDGQATITNRLVPYTVFIDPQLGRVGLSEREAEEQGYNFKVAKMPMSHVARAMEVDETRGLMKVMVDVDTDQILGCAIFGYQGGEIMALLQVAMMSKLPYTALRDGIFAHPTLAEALNNLFATLDE